MSHVWNCSNWSEFLVLQKQQPISSFQHLTTINMYKCNNIKYLFSPLMGKLLSNLKKVEIRNSDSIEEVVSDRDDRDGEMHTSASTHTFTTLFPRLHSLTLEYLNNLKHIGGGGGAKGRSKFSQLGDVSWSICQYSREIQLWRCDALSILIPSYAVGQMQKLEKLRIESCHSLKEVFETQGMVDNNIGDGAGSNSINVDEGNVATRYKYSIMPQLSNLREIIIYNCELLEYVFTYSALQSLRCLEKLMIERCKAIKVIVKQENGEQTMASSDVVVFPCLKCVELFNLPNLLGFFLGMNGFEWKSLEKLVISKCPQIKVFTSGHSAAPNLNFIHSNFGMYSLDCGLNVPLTTTLHEIPFQSSESISLCPTTTEATTPWSYHDLVEIQLYGDDDVKKMIIPSNELLQLKRLERVQVIYCYQVEEIFEVVTEGTYSNVEIPSLKDVVLIWLGNLKYIWKNNQGRVLEFPNLTRLHIEGCDSLKHVFTSSMVGSLLQLQDLHITDNKNIEVIVKEEEEEEERYGRVKHMELPRLKSIAFRFLPSLWILWKLMIAQNSRFSTCAIQLLRS